MGFTQVGHTFALLDEAGSLVTGERTQGGVARRQGSIITAVITVQVQEAGAHVHSQVLMPAFALKIVGGVTVEDSNHSGRLRVSYVYCLVRTAAIEVAATTCTMAAVIRRPIDYSLPFGVRADSCSRCTRGACA